MRKLKKPVFIVSLLSPWLNACGETVNYDIQEQPIQSLSAGTTASGDSVSGSTNADGGPSSGEGADKDLADAGLPEEALALCAESQQLTQHEAIVFPEIAAGTTCAFGSGENLSRRDAYFRAYLRQSKQVRLPAGAVFCGFSLEHQNRAMVYDDEMFFLINERILMSTKDYSGFFPKDGIFRNFAWKSLLNQPYDALDTARGSYCVGGADGLSECSLPPTETTGRIALSFDPELTLQLANQLQNEKVLDFSWITTGDNDDSDCRHSEISFTMDVHYVMPAQLKAAP